MRCLLYITLKTKHLRGVRCSTFSPGPNVPCHILGQVLSLLCLSPSVSIYKTRALKGMTSKPISALAHYTSCGIWKDLNVTKLLVELISPWICLAFCHFCKILSHPLLVGLIPTSVSKASVSLPSLNKWGSRLRVQWSIAGHANSRSWTRSWTSWFPACPTFLAPQILVLVINNDTGCSWEPVRVPSHQWQVTTLHWFFSKSQRLVWLSRLFPEALVNPQ